MRKGLKEDADFIQKNLEDLCASYQSHIVEILLKKFQALAKKYDVRHLAIAGGVSANSLLRSCFIELCEAESWQAHIPDFQYCTDNAAMIAIVGHYKKLAGDFADWDVKPFTRERKLKDS